MPTPLERRIMGSSRMRKVMDKDPVLMRLKKEQLKERGTARSKTAKPYKVTVKLVELRELKKALEERIRYFVKEKRKLKTFNREKAWADYMKKSLQIRRRRYLLLEREKKVIYKEARRTLGYVK